MRHQTTIPKGGSPPRKSNKLTPATRTYLRNSFKNFDGHPYDRKFFFAQLAQRTAVPQPSITKFYYNDRRRNPHFYDDIRRQKTKHHRVTSAEEEDENRPVSNVTEQPIRMENMKEEELAAVNLLLSIRYLLQTQSSNNPPTPVERCQPNIFHRPEGAISHHFHQHRPMLQKPSTDSIAF